MEDRGFYNAWISIDHISKETANKIWEFIHSFDEATNVSVSVEPGPYDLAPLTEESSEREDVFPDSRTTWREAVFDTVTPNQPQVWTHDPTPLPVYTGSGDGPIGTVSRFVQSSQGLEAVMDKKETN